MPAKKESIKPTKTASKQTAPKLVKKPKEATTVPLSEYEKVVTELQAAQAEKVGVKTELSKWKSRALEAEKKVSDLGNEIGAVETKGFKWALKKVWPLLAFIIVILGVTVWAMAVHISKDTARENTAVNAYKSYVQDSLKRVDYKKTDEAVESSDKVISGIPRVNPADVKKN